MANEKRLIYANALADKLQQHHDFFVNAYGGFSNLPAKDKARVDEITHCIAEITNAPTVDAVEVVRCKKCKSFTYDGYHKHYYCSNAKGMRYAVLPEDYCSYGERKDNG